MFTYADKSSILEPTIQQQMLLNAPRQLNTLIERLKISYGDADISVIESIEADIQLPLNPAGSIEDDLTNMILLKNQLPPQNHVTWSDFKTTNVFTNFSVPPKEQ